MCSTTIHRPAREEIIENPDSDWRDRSSYRAYVVLTLCRILYSAAKGDVTSKTEAAKWATADLTDEPGFLDLIELAEDVSQDRSIASVPLSPIEQFINYVSRRMGA